MDKCFNFEDLKSFECSPLSELDKRIYDDQSLPSALSSDQLSASRISNESFVNNGSDAKLSVLASFSTSLDALSPSQVFVSSINEPESEGCYLTVPLQGKSSTPQLTVPKQKIPACSDLSYAELRGSQISWDVSIIKSESPKVMTASGPALSPKTPSSSQNQSGLSP